MCTYFLYYCEGSALHGTQLLSRSQIFPLGHCLHALIYIVVPIKLLKILNKARDCKLLFIHTYLLLCCFCLLFA